MNRTLLQSEWVRQAGALTIDDHAEDQLLCAHVAVQHLAVDAAALLAASDCGNNAQCNCGLQSFRGGASACALLADLAAIAPTGKTPVNTPVAADPVVAYLDSLLGATRAVAICRRVLHQSDVCLFSAAGPRAEVCGHVLAAIHQL